MLRYPKDRGRSTRPVKTENPATFRGGVSRTGRRGGAGWLGHFFAVAFARAFFERATFFFAPLSAFGAAFAAF